MQVFVAGAGIGGLATMLSLESAGVDAVCVDAARDLSPLGVGINVLPHAVRELTELGLGDALDDAAVATAELAYYDRFGNRIWAEPRGLAAGYRWPQYSIHRGRLQQVLLDAVRDRLGDGAVRTGVAVEGFEQDGAAVKVMLRQRSSDTRGMAEADVLVGADGINSAVRAQLHPNEGPPLWNGIQMWRGVAEHPPFLGGRVMIMAGSNLTSKFVAYPIAAASPTGRRADGFVNWVAEVKVAGPATVPADWCRRGRHEDVMPWFAGWRFGWLDVPSLIEATPEIFTYPMVDRDPLSRWRHGSVTLLGDAAHPTYPIGSNGASQAVLDARSLAWHLAVSESPRAALDAYEETRRPPTTEVVLANRSLGPEKVMALVEQRAPGGFTHVQNVLTTEELRDITGHYRRVAGFDIAELNDRPSWTVPCRKRSTNTEETQ